MFILFYSNLYFNLNYNNELFYNDESIINNNKKINSLTKATITIIIIIFKINLL